MRTPRTRRTRGLTLIEAVISIAVFSVVSILSMMAMQTTGETTAMVSASFDAQLESERLLSLLRGQLQGTGTGAGGLAVIDANAGDKQIEVQYRPVDPAKLVFNPANLGDGHPAGDQVRAEHRRELQQRHGRRQRPPHR